ncbi:MAG: hypothetical protein CME58_11260 [Halieaceae bacterium]|nr:hypothetical protein [Halieaceae bacterium]
MPNSPAFGVVFFSFFLSVLTGCAMQTGEQKPPPLSGDAPPTQSAPELMGVCDCPERSREDQFNVALQALVRGEYEAARSALAGHAEGGDAMATIEADAGQDLTDLLVRYMGDALPADASEGSDRAVLINLVLSLIDRLETNVATLGAQNAELEADLEKREEALKRLRELTLGQPEA